MGNITNLTGAPNDEVLNDFKERGAVIIDVRTPAEFQGGHPKQSKNFPLQTISNQVDKIKKLNKPIIVVCRSGARSGQAAGILKSNGIEVVNAGPWQNVADLY